MLNHCNCKPDNSNKIYKKNLGYTFSNLSSIAYGYIFLVQFFFKQTSNVLTRVSTIQVLLTY